MITRLTTIEELKELVTEIMLNKTGKVTKVNNGSVLNAFAFGIAKGGQKAIKEMAVLETHVLPEAGYGIYLDNMARLSGIGQRFGQRQSSGYILIFADPGTVYSPVTNTFKSTSGVDFELEKDFTIGTFGFGYAKVRSVQFGEGTNVDPLTINSVNNPPTGHLYCINEFKMQYGADSEEDDALSRRLREGVDILSKDTISFYEQIFMKINENVLRVFYTGRDSSNRPILSILTVNGIDLTDAELNDILIRAEKYLSLDEMRSLDGSGTINLVLNNIEWQPIDISMRVQLEDSFDPDEVRKDIQIRLSKYLDYRYWKQGQRLEWDIMLEIVQNTDGIHYVDDNFFYPRNDIITDSKKLPRIRGFQMLDINGNIIQDFQGNLNPVYFPNQIDFSFQATVLKTL